MPTRQTAEVYRVSTQQDQRALVVELNALLGRLTTRLDRLEGLNGTPKFYGAVDMNGKRLTNVGRPSADTDAVPAGLALTRSSTSQPYDAGQVAIVNLPAGSASTDAVNVSQLTTVVQANDLSNEAFVVVALSSALTSERALAAEATVLTLTDGGPNSTLTVGVATNGVTDAKLRQGAATSVVGRSANSTGNVADIAAGADNRLLGRRGGALTFAAVALGAEVSGTLPVANGGTNSAAALNNNRIIVSSGGAVVEAGALTNGQLLIGSTGAAPVAAALTAGSGITVTNGAGAITVATSQTLTAGTYTPTLTNVSNLDASTAYECQYHRIGATVTVSGRVDVDPTLAATSTQLGISLPVASNLGATEDCAGVAFASGIAGQGAAILADAANDRAQLQYVSGDITNQAMYFVFQYQVI